MKYTYIIIALGAVIIAGAVGTLLLTQDKKAAEEIPEGFHMMSDGTLMRNDIGTEGMGALSELQEQITEEDTRADALGSIDANAKVYDIKGVNYGFDVKEIRVKKGDTVIINFESTDGFHDWVLDEFDARTEKVQPGKPTSVTFVADTEGTFEYYCSVGQHRAHGMVGSLIVE